MTLGFAICWSGRARDSLPYFHKAIRLSPHDPLRWAFEGHIGNAHVLLGDYELAVEWSKKSCRDPASPFWPDIHLASALAELGRLDEARAAIIEARRKQPDLSLTFMSKLLRPMYSDYRKQSLDSLRRAGLPEN